MKTIKLSVRPVLTEIFLRQTANARGHWNDCRFYVNTPIEECDWWIVCHNTGLAQQETTLCDPAHIVYISLEPDDSWYPIEFINQFSTLVLCDRSIKHPNIIYKNGLNWWVGMQVKYGNLQKYSPLCTLDYDKLSSLKTVNKTKDISIVCSNKTFWSGHKKRLKFLDKLMSHPISKHIDMFGGGIKNIDDKWDAIAPYKYHIALENTVLEDYWSEKLADSFLGYAYPIYYGCPNIFDYFQNDALQVIDLDNIDKTIQSIETLLNTDPYAKHIDAISSARIQVLNDYNIFQLMADICKEPASKKVGCKLDPCSSFSVSKHNPSVLSTFNRIVNNILAKK